MTMSMYQVIKAGGLTQGGCNFDAKVRRQSFTSEDLIHAHVGGVDLCARAFRTAAKIIEDGSYDALLAKRYAGWEEPEAQAMLCGKMSLTEIEAKALTNNIDPQPRSGRQEEIENLLMRSIYTDQI
jgi:xylose isomerase